MANKITRTKREEGRAARKSITPTTPAVSSLPKGTRLTMKYKGREYQGEVVEQDGIKKMVVKGIKGAWISLSGAATAITKKPARGGLVWRRAGADEPLVGRINYQVVAGAAPGSRRTSRKAGAGSPLRKSTGRKPKAGSGGGGTVKRSWQCGNCKVKLPTQAALAKHVAKEHAS